MGCFFEQTKTQKIEGVNYFTIKIMEWKFTETLYTNDSHYYQKWLQLFKRNFLQTRIHKKYNIFKTIGSGAFAEVLIYKFLLVKSDKQVYKVEDKDTQEVFAAKYFDKSRIIGNTPILVRNLISLANNILKDCFRNELWIIR